MINLFKRYSLSYQINNGDYKTIFVDYFFFQYFAVRKMQQIKLTYQNSEIIFWIAMIEHQQTTENILYETFNY